MHWPKPRCRSRHLRRVALASLITATASGIGSAGDRAATKLESADAQHRAPLIADSVGRVVSKPRIITYGRTNTMPQRSVNQHAVKAIDGYIQKDSKAIRQTAGTSSDAGIAVDSAVDLWRVDVPNREIQSKLTLREATNPDSCVDQAEGLIEQVEDHCRRLESCEPPASQEPNDEDAGFSCSISDDSLSMPKQNEATLVRPGAAIVLDVPRQEPSSQAPINQTPVAQDPLDQDLVAQKHASQELASNEPAWQEPVIKVDDFEPEMIGQSGVTKIEPLPVPAPIDSSVNDDYDEQIELAEQAPLPEIVSDSLASDSLESEPEPPTSIRENADVRPIGANSQPTDLQIRSTYAIAVAESRTVFAVDRIVRVSVEDPTICNALTTGKDSLLLVGRESGSTRVAVWTEATPNRKPIIYQIEVDGFTGQEAERELADKMTKTIQTMFGIDGVRVQATNDGLVARGKVATETQAKQVLAVVRSASLRRVQDQIVVR